MLKILKKLSIVNYTSQSLLDKELVTHGWKCQMEKEER